MLFEGQGIPRFISQSSLSFNGVLLFFPVLCRHKYGTKLQIDSLYKKVYIVTI